jgi:hypothetical protein
MLPLPAALPPNPFVISCAEMETVRTTGPALASAEGGEILKLTNCGGVVSAAAAPASNAIAHSLGRPM